MAAVVVTTARPLPTHRPASPRPRGDDRPALELLEGGRRGARAYARAQAPRARRLPAGVYHRRRLGVVVVVATLVLVGYLASVGVAALLARPAVGAPATPAAASGAHPAGRVYVVQPGDTLWSIARSVHPHGDLRPVVDRLEARAGGATIVPGQRITLDGIGG